MNRLVVLALSLGLSSPALAEAGDAARGQRNFRACAACHSLEADRNMTGPSLAGLWGRRAGSLRSFTALGEMRRVLRPGGRLLFVEHGLAPDQRVRWWQDRLDPAWKSISGGCHLNRPIQALIEQAGFRIDRLETGYMPGLKPMTFMYEGSAAPADLEAAARSTFFSTRYSTSRVNLSSLHSCPAGFPRSNL